MERGVREKGAWRSDRRANKENRKRDKERRVK